MCIRDSHTAANGTTTPSGTPDCSVTTECAVADTTYDFDFSGETGNDFVKGEVLLFSCEPENDINDAIMTIKLQLNTSGS